MQKKTIFLGYLFIILLWIMLISFLLVNLDNLENSLNNIMGNLIFNNKIEKPLYYLKGFNYSKGYPEFIPFHEQLFDGFNVRLNPVLVRINSDGFRDREFSKIKPENVFRIVFLGDSFTFGWGVELNDSLPKQLESLLNKRDDRVIYEVLNFGVPGMNTWEEVEMFKNKGLRYDPDIVIVGFVTNDVENETLKRELYQERLLKEQQKIEDSKINHENFFSELSKEIRELEVRRVEKLSINERYKIVLDPLMELINLSQQENFSVVLFDFHSSPDLEDEFFNKLSEKNFNFYFIKAPYVNLDMSLHPLDSHPCPKAYKLHAEKIYETLIKENLITSE